MSAAPGHREPLAKRYWNDGGATGFVDILAARTPFRVRK
jgi:hypothetical protein